MAYVRDELVYDKVTVVRYPIWYITDQIPCPMKQLKNMNVA